jgi:hypothetical protein
MWKVPSISGYVLGAVPITSRYNLQEYITLQKRYKN